jgi:transposase
MTTIKPVSPIAPNEQVTKVEDLVFGVGAERCGLTNRCYERGSGALPHEEQTKLFIRQAELAKRQAAIEQEEALRQAEAAAAAEQKGAPKEAVAMLRLVRA